MVEKSYLTESCLEVDMAKSAQQIEESLAKMQRLGRRLSLIFTVLFALACISLCVVTTIVFTMISRGALHDPSCTVSIIVPPMYLVICGVGAMTLRGIGQDMARGESPFTVSHSRQISVLGWLLVAVTVIEIIVSPGFVSLVIGPFSFISAPHVMFEELTIPLDLGSILGAVACFSISAIWSYGALLQTQAEDLV